MIPFRSFLGKHKEFLVLIFLASIAGFLYLLYDLLLFYWYGQSGEVYLAAAPGTEGYVSTIWPRLREIIDGYPRVSDVNLWEYRHGPTTLHPLLTPYLYLPIFFFAGLYWTMPVGNFIFAAACFLLLYKIFKLITDKFCLSACAAAIFIMIRDLPSLLLPTSLNQIKDLIKVFLPFAVDASRKRLNFLSMEAVMPGFIIFGSFFIFLFLALKVGRNRHFWLLGIFYGLLFYTYTFYWIYGTIVLGMAAALHFVIKKYKNGLKFAYSGFLGAIISSYFWLVYLEARTLPQLKDYIIRAGGIEEGREFRWSQWRWYLFYCILTLLVYIYTRKYQKQFVAKFIGILLIAGFISFNIQLVTGINIQPDHWHLRVMRFPLVFAFVVLISWLIDVTKSLRLRRFIFLVLGSATISVLLGSGHTAYASAKKRFTSFSLPLGIHQSLQWINENLEKDSVIITPDLYMNDLFPYYTSSRVFIPRSISSWASEDERLERLFIVYKLFSVSEDYLLRELNPKRLEEMSPASLDVSLFDFIYQTKFYNRSFDAYFRGDADRPIPPEIFNDLVARYRNFSLDAGKPEFKYRADYIYVGPLEERIVKIELTKFDSLFKRVYDKDGIIIYQIYDKPKT